MYIKKHSPELLSEFQCVEIDTNTIIAAENLLSSMEDILLWSKGQMEYFKPLLKQVSVHQLFDDTKKVFSGYSAIQFDYRNPDNIAIYTDENYLKTIIRNLTGNAIKALDSCDAYNNNYPSNSELVNQNPSIVWKAWRSQNQVFLSIEDNGKGAITDQFKALYDDTEVAGIKYGLGLHLIRDLAKAIDCVISVDSKIGIGTTFTLKF